jgi:hypothetical protein
MATMPGDMGSGYSPLLGQSHQHKIGTRLALGTFQGQWVPGSWHAALILGPACQLLPGVV